MGDVYQEVDEVMTKLRVGMHKIKPCSRKYAFELPDIPKEADYLKLMYPYESECANPIMQMRLLTEKFRASTSSGHERRYILACLWYNHCTLRAIRFVEEYHGTLLAQNC